MEKLLNCPFCGGEVEIKYFVSESQITFYMIVCGECGCKQVPSIHKEAVVKAWNTRKPMDAIIKQLEFQAEQHNKRADEFLDKNIQISNHNRGRARSYEHALEVVKGLD